MGKKLIEMLQPNVVNAPVLYVGCGGIGSKIVKGVADRALHDDNTMLRFICMDTDVNDIINVDKGANLRAVQTSSTATIETYLKNDRIARTQWFPNNKMLDSKPVSEGAGQVRAISRLALNSTIKEGKIIELYNCIDELFLKDGGKFKQAIKVVIASTAAGGTGSGIAMEIGMLIRHYINKTYPEAAVMIRGFLVMPGVLDTVIKSQSERESIRANGYATIKEINAFMMKGSGFFDTVPELKRYQNLHISIPSAISEEERLSNLPFDFCFLMDRTDSNSGNMISLPQYIQFASQSIYEQTIGPMNKSSSSQEDNILKLCIRPESLGRCRFAGLGASRLVYPYNSIRTYIALNWARAAIIGSTSNKNISDAQREQLLKESWLQYDVQYKEERKAYEDNPASSQEPQIENVYVNAMLQGRDESAGNNFTARLWSKYLNVKINETKEADGAVATESSPDRMTILDEIFDDVESSTQKVMRFYVASVIDEILKSKLTSFDSTFNDNLKKAGKDCAQGSLTHAKRYSCINKVQKLSEKDDVAKASAALAKAIFYSKSPLNKQGLGNFMLEKFVTANGKAMHPNAIRFMLYELKTFLTDARMRFNSGSDYTSYISKVKDAISGSEGAKNKYDVSKTLFKKESSLKEMCEICDDKELYGGSQDGIKCNSLLGSYYQFVYKFLICKIGATVCDIALPAVDNLIQAFQDFFNSFEAKVPEIEKKKEDLVASLQFKKGDYVLNLFNDEQHLAFLSDIVDRPSDSGEETNKLFARIFESVRSNAYINEKRGINPLNYEATEDIFDDVIIKYYEKMVEDNVDAINVGNILQAIKLEFTIGNALDVSRTPEHLRDKKQRNISTEDNLRKYIEGKLTQCRNLASPGIKKNTQDEAREVNAVACNSALEDAGGIRVNDYLANATQSDTVSAYELRFFRAIYNITPTQLSKLAAPAATDIEDQFALTNDAELDLPSTGDYFRIYQKYMDTIGPDSKTSAVITPHIDQRWNAISVLPELDMDYQRKLMSKIHKAMIYGFVYNRIKLRRISEENPEQKVYMYYDNKEIRQEMIVSNGTRCDELYEVLDSLYFDRKAVGTIRDYVNSVRVKIREKGCKSIDDSDFFKELAKLNRKRVINLPDAEKDEVISLFEIVLLYFNSLPAQDKDESEIRVIIDSIIEVINAEIASFTNNYDTIMSRTANILIAQFETFVKSYSANHKMLYHGLFSDDVLEATQGSLIRYFKDHDMLIYVDTVRSISIKI